jgi:hypothetical protein
VGVYLDFPAVRNVYLDANGTIAKIVTNIQGYCTPTVYDASGAVVSMTDEVKKQYDKLVPTIGFNGGGVFQPNTNIQERNNAASKVETESPGANRVQIIPERVIFVNDANVIYGIVCNTPNTPDNEVVLLVRKGGRWLYGSVQIPMNEEIRKQYEALLPVVNWKGVGIRYGDLGK